ncbi:Structure-specific endonuclease subunit SLX1 [Gossypium arboreum]|uniref:Structure-specific endonuclease subunit SLX1 n=1 Tax=Gossypium arboreum TaxID=29729 RepID=A0A0B0PPL6_GOSAR|nr:Structure-specific endonuclease subunit SLX1 [Gossypium arboreum]
MFYLFEWAWQHPQESVAVRQAAATFKSFSGLTNKIKLAYTMLTLPVCLNITVNYFSTKYTTHSASCPSLPEQMKVKSIIHEACHKQSEHIEEYGRRKPGESSNLGVDMSIAGKESLRGMRFTYAVEADEDLQPWVKEKLPTPDEEYEKLGDTCTFGVYHRQPFDVICSPVRTSSSVVTSLSNEETAEGTNISIIDKEFRIPS